jgi:hypothetical protein
MCTGAARLAAEQLDDKIYVCQYKAESENDLS